MRLFFYMPWFLLMQACTGEKGIHPQVGTITESVYASGHVKAEEQYNVVSKVPGVLLKKHVNVGDFVEKGKILFTINNPTARFAIENAQLGVRKAEDNVNKIKELKRQTRFAKNKYLQDSIMFLRQRKLWEQNIGTKVQLEQTELTLVSSRIEYLNRIIQLEQVQNAWRIEYATAKNNARILKENAEDYIIRSETNGRVYTIYPEEGEGITPQTVLAVVGKQDRFLIEIQVDENDISRIQTGQEIFVTMDSYKDFVFKAAVTKIYPIMNENTGTFTVEGVFTKSPTRIYPHLNLEANILIGTKKNALIIPREYLTEEEYVLLDDGHKAKVKVGLKNFEFAEVISGLKKEQILLKP